MFKKSFSADGKLEIVVLGPMRGEKNDPSSAIREAILAILAETEAREILGNKGISLENITVAIPDEWRDPDIADGVFSRLDTADLVIVNITPKPNKDNTSPNVFYELALIHALGIPYIMVQEEGHNVPFYLRNYRNHWLADFEVETIVNELRNSLIRFIDDSEPTTFARNPISTFYQKLPVIDISGAVGLATGYFYNFLKRLLKDGGFPSVYPDTIKQVIVVRPLNIYNTYEQDLQTLKKTLAERDIELSTQKYDPIPTDQDGALWFEHVDGIVVDIPRTIYPLRKSPRLLTLQERLSEAPRVYGAELRREVLSNAADKLLDKVEDIIMYHLGKDDRLRENTLHFTTMEEVPALIEKLRE